MRGAIALVVLAHTVAQQLDECIVSTACPEGQYCTHYEGSDGSSISYCYDCLDQFGFSCLDYDDSIDDCSTCPAAEHSNNTQHIECSSHAECAGDFYCAAYSYGNIAVQACWPCVDENGHTCAEYDDPVDGTCPGKCSEQSVSAPVPGGCTSHASCAAGEYCSSYKSSLTGTDIVACYPCVDSEGKTCEYYDDSVNGDCSVCSGSGSGTPALDACTTHEECGPGSYCSSYVNPNIGQIVDCWPCLDSYQQTCETNGDAIDGKCDHCRETAPAPPPGQRAEGCVAHADCDPGYYCADVQASASDHLMTCIACKGKHNVSCEVRPPALRALPSARHAQPRATVYRKLHRQQVRRVRKRDRAEPRADWRHG